MTRSPISPSTSKQLHCNKSPWGQEWFVLKPVVSAVCAHCLLFLVPGALARHRHFTSEWLSICSHTILFFFVACIMLSILSPSL